MKGSIHISSLRQSIVVVQTLVSKIHSSLLTGIANQEPSTGSFTVTQM